MDRVGFGRIGLLLWEVSGLFFYLLYGFGYFGGGGDGVFRIGGRDKIRL